jgi:hypothetical protein
MIEDKKILSKYINQSRFLLVNFREMPSKLVEIQAIAHNEIVT